VDASATSLVRTHNSVRPTIGCARHARPVSIPAVAIALACAVVAGCATINPTISVRPLPEAANPDVCRGVATDANLAGGLFDPRVAWLKFPLGKEVPLVWPRGWEARFAPDLEVVSREGHVVLRAGDQVTGVCLKGSPERPSAVLMIGSL
jgi:hypothetical protein